MIYCPHCNTRVRLQPNNTDCGNCNATLLDLRSREAVEADYQAKNAARRLTVGAPQ